MGLSPKPQYGHAWVSMTTTKDKLNHSTMVNTCVVLGCGSRSDRDHHLSFHLLPLINKTLLKKLLHQIGQKNVPFNNNSRVCSKHFKQSHKHILHGDEFPTESTRVTNISFNTHSEKVTGTPPIIHRGKGREWWWWWQENPWCWSQHGSTRLRKREIFFDHAHFYWSHPPI